MKEALLYEQLDNNLVRCKLCSHRCTIGVGKRGICSVRENRNGRLYSLNYERLLTSQVDPIEKKPLFHYLPGSRSYSIATAGCNFRCGFCQNWQISQMTKGEEGTIRGDAVSPEEIVHKAQSNRCSSISYTYTEPTIFFEYAFETARLAHQEELQNIFVTNGYQTPETIELMVGVIDAANIDLKSFSDDYYRQLCGARLDPVLDSIRLMYQGGIWIEVTTLIVPGENDTSTELSRIAEFITELSQDIPWHISRFYPQYQMDNLQATTLDTLDRAYRIGKKAGLNFVYLGNVPGHKYENTYCPQCNSIVIERSGYLVRSNTKDFHCSACGHQIPIVLS